MHGHVRQVAVRSSTRTPRASAEPSPQAQAIHEEVRIAPCDPSWPLRFSLERDRLLALFPQVLAVEHIGSTAVAGMEAKPVIDILAGVTDMAAADALFEPLLTGGYTTSRAFNSQLTDRRWFMRCANGTRTHHLHVVVHLGPVWAERILFRDLLRADAGLARSYSRLKARLAVRFRHDREAYTRAKGEFVAEALART